jgi:hypothetical protein
MKQRIYWLLPNLASARRIMADLLRAGIETRHIHFAARDGLELTGLHAANVLQTSDVVHAAQSGLVFGGATGICTGLLVALYFPIVGDSPQWAVAALLAVLGGVIGAWSSSMIGISIPSPRLERLRAPLPRADLPMVDVPYWQAQPSRHARAAHPRLQASKASTASLRSSRTGIRAQEIPWLIAIALILPSSARCRFTCSILVADADGLYRRPCCVAGSTGPHASHGDRTAFRSCWPRSVPSCSTS